MLRSSWSSLARITRRSAYTALIAVTILGAVATNAPSRPIPSSKQRPWVARGHDVIRVARQWLGLGQASVWPSYSTMSAPSNSTGNVAWFEVDNTDWNPENYSLYCFIMSPVTSCDVPWSVYVDGYGSASVDAIFATSSAGVGGVTLSVDGMIGESEGHYDVTVEDPRGAPAIALASGPDFRDVSRCIADCFEKTMSYSPPTYVSMDVPRAVTLVYRSGSAHPIGNVQLDVTDNSATPADVYEVQVQRQDGSYVTFLNGTQTLFFQSAGHYVATRLAAAFDATSLLTGRYTYTAIVTSIWNSDGFQQPAYATVRVIVLNESGSPYGAGWTVAGAGRAYVQSDGVLVVDGSGSASFFSGSCSPYTSCSYTSPSGDFSTLSTAPDGYYHRRFPDGATLLFDGNGYESSAADRFGNTTSYSYRYDGPTVRLGAITDPAGFGTSFDYQTGDMPQWKTYTLKALYANGRNAYFGIDNNNNFTDFVDVDGIYYGLASYDGNHRLTQFHDRRGGDWNYTYATDGTIATQLAPAITINGNSNQRPLAQFTGPSTLILSAITGTVGTQGNPVPCSLDSRAKVVNPRGYGTNYTLNQWGSPTVVQDALGRNETFGYQGTTGQMTSHHAVSGRQTTYTWDGPRLIQVVDGPTTVLVEYGETVFNQPTHIHGDVSEEWMTYNTNQTGRPLLTSRVAGQGPTTYSFDANGRILTVTDTTGHVTAWYHQPMCCGGLANTDSISPPGLLASWFMRDSYGRVIATRHADGRRDSTYYDLLNRDTTDVDGLLHRTSYAYDLLFLQTVTDAKAQQYSFVRNALGWIEQETRPGSTHALVSAYDANGNVISTTNRQGGAVTHAFDPLDRDTLITADGQTTRITYGSTDQFVRLINSESTDSLVADSYGRFTQANTSRPASGGTYSISYSLGNDGTLQGFSATSNRWSGSRGPSFTYDSTKHVKTLTSFAGSSTITWNRDGLPTQVQFPNGMTASSAFTSDHDVVSMLYSNTSPGAYFLRDSLGRLSMRAPSSFADASLYAYNADGSLGTWSIAPQSGNCQTFNASYGYECWVGFPTQTTTYTYDQVGNIQSGGATYTANRLTSANGYTMTYDEDGNLETKTGSGFSESLSWNSLGQLTSVTTNGTIVTFGYDGLGRRVRKSVSGGATTGYLYAGDNLYMELDASGNPVTEYAYWPSIDAPHAMSRGGVLYYFTQDPQSANITSVVKASDNSVQALYDYAPFGILRSGSFDNVPSGGNALHFAARQYDSETGMSYFRARYYDPQVGRFISEDPIGLAGGMNPYVYAGNDPINRVDPFGLDDDPQTLPPVEVTECAPGFHQLGKSCVKDFAAPTVPRNGPPGTPTGPGPNDPPPGTYCGYACAKAPPLPPQHPVCGGIFALMGAHVGKGPAELGAYLIPLQYDSKEGYSTGGLLEGSLGILGGAKEWMWNWSQWKSTGSWLGLIGERAKLPGTRAGLGVVDAGFFGDSHGDAGGYLTVDGMGGGAYANSSCGS